MKVRNFLCAVLMTVVVGLLSSCSKRGEILDNVPADVTMVATVNLEKMLSAVGVTVKGDGSVDMCPPMREVIGDESEVIEAMAAIKSAGVMDMENIVISVDNDGVVYTIMPVNDMDKVIELSKDNIGWNDGSNGYKVGRLDGQTFLLKDDLLWVVSRSKDAVKAVEGQIKKAGKMSVSRLDGVAEAMSRDNMMNIAVKSGFASMLMGRGDKNEVPVEQQMWNVASLQNGADGSLVANWEQMQSTGKTVKAEGLQNINPALLAYVPENFNVVVAAGLTGEFDWSPLRQLVTLVGGFQTAAFMSVAGPYIESIDGSVLLAAAPSEGDDTELDFILMAHMPQNKINALTDMIKSMFLTAGMTPTVTRDGLIAVPQYGKTMYIGNVDGYLGISTVGFDNTRNNSLAPTFVNKDMAASVSLNPLSDFVSTAPEGTSVVLSASMDDGKGEIKLKATGTQWPVLVFLLSAVI